MAYEPYRDFAATQAIGEQLEKERLTNALARAKVKEVEQTNALREQLMDQMAGYGTPGERMGQMGGEKPALQQALGQYKATGQTPTFTNVGGYRALWPGSKEKPFDESQGYIGGVGMQDIQPRMSELANLMARKQLLGSAEETPREKAELAYGTKGMELQKTDKWMGQQREEEAGKEQRAERKLEEERRKEEMVAVPKMNVAHLQNRLSSVDKRRAAAETRFSRAKEKITMNPFYGTDTPQGLRLLEDLAKLAEASYSEAQSLDKTERAIYKQLEPFEKKLGLTSSFESLYEEEGGPAGPSGELARVVTALEKKLGPDVVRELDTLGVTPESVMQRAMAMGVPIEQFIDQWIEEGGKKKKVVKPKKQPTALVAP